MPKTTALTEILLRRENKLLLPNTAPIGSTSGNIPEALTFQMELLNLGYVTDEGLNDALLQLPKSMLITIIGNAIHTLQSLKGADKKYRLFYPGFPQEVMGLPALELAMNALTHYWSEGTIFPERLPRNSQNIPLALDPGSLRVLSAGSSEDLRDTLKHLMASPVSISGTDREDLETLLGEFWDATGTLQGIFPETIPHREVKAAVCAFLARKAVTEDTPYGRKLSCEKYLCQYLDTPTDILRLCAALSGSHPGLMKGTRFASFPRRARRLILSLLESILKKKGTENALKEALERKNPWIRLGEKLHPGEAKGLTETRQFFYFLRNPKECPVRTEQALLECHLENGNLYAAREYLKTRPGIFARHLDRLLRTGTKEDACEAYWDFRKTIHEVPTPLLLTLRRHFVYRTIFPGSPNVYLPKGNTQKAWYDGNPLPDLDPWFTRALFGDITQVLRGRFASLEPLGKTWIDPELKTIALPKSQRSASKALRSIPRGSRLKLGNRTGTIRAFIWWTNTENGDRVDLDLSVGFYGKDWGFMGRIGWDCLRGDAAALSGDITNGGDFGGKGVAEFLDVNLEKALREGYRYAVLQVHSYTGQTFRDLSHASFGWMERDGLKSGEPFEPATVSQRIDLDAGSIQAIPAAIDLETGEVIWCDMSGTLGGTSYDNRNIHTLKGTQAALWACAERPGENLYELFLDHAVARGFLVDTKEDADTLFTLEPVKDLPEGKVNITAYQTVRIQSEFMT